MRYITPSQRKGVRMLRASIVAVALAGLSIPAPVQAQTCTRDNLKTFIAHYFKAVETHSISALPTAPNVRSTENGVETRPGDGFVKTGGKATILRSLLDTERCATVTQALVDETVDGVTEPTIVAVRLKVESGRVTEIETLLGRKGASKMAGFDFYDPKALLATKDHDWEVPLPAASRQTSAYKNDHANRYFSRNTWLPAAKSAPKLSVLRVYRPMATRLAAPTASASPRSEPQNQPSAISAGTAPSRMPFS